MLLFFGGGSPWFRGGLPGPGGGFSLVPGGGGVLLGPGGGSPWSWGGSPWSGGVLLGPGGGFSLVPGGFSRGPPPVNRITDTCKNITLATTSLRPVKMVSILFETLTVKEHSFSFDQ